MSLLGKLTNAKWAKLAKCSADTALRDLQFLVERGILVRTAGATSRLAGLTVSAISGAVLTADPSFLDMFTFTFLQAIGYVCDNAFCQWAAQADQLAAQE